MSGSFKITYGTPLHTRIRDAILARKRLSSRKMSDRRTAWAAAEDQFMVSSNYETENDAKRKTLRKNGKPQFTTLEIPYSYAMLLSAHTYVTSVFLSRSPIHQFMARHGQPEQATMGLEALIDYQVTVGGAVPVYYIWLHDMMKYGLGVMCEYWDEEFTNVTEIVERPKKYLGIEMPGTKEKVRQTRRVAGYTGNKMFNIRPQDWYPDPRVTLANFQRGEFCGRYVEVGWNTLLKGRENGRYYNLETLARVGKTGSLAGERDTGGKSMQLPDAAQQSIDFSRLAVDEADKGFFGLLEMEIELVPKDWGVGSSTSPEKWVFTLGNDEVIIDARPMNYNHGKFSCNVLEYEIEGYNLSKRGMLEVLQPLNSTMEWLFNTHFFNVRKALNDQYVVDPSRVTMKDMTDPNAGKLVRLRPEAYGTDARTAVFQLQTNDMTRTHIGDVAIVGDLMQRATGVVDNIMGMLNQGGRKTATEVRTSSTMGVNRLKTLSEYASAVGFAPHAQKLVQNTQQLLEKEQMYRVAGDLAPQMAPYVLVSPDTIQGFFDFVPVDGTMPVDRFAQSNLWKDILMNVGRVPQVAQQYDMAGIFAWMARLAGLRNIQQFRIQVLPDQQFQNNIQAGNTTPVGGQNAAIAAGTGKSPADANDMSRVGRTGAIPGMGPTA